MANLSFIWTYSVEAIWTISESHHDHHFMTQNKSGAKRQGSFCHSAVHSNTHLLSSLLRVTMTIILLSAVQTKNNKLFPRGLPTNGEIKCRGSKGQGAISFAGEVKESFTEEVTPVLSPEEFNSYSIQTYFSDIFFKSLAHKNTECQLCALKNTLIL